MDEARTAVDEVRKDRSILGSSLLDGSRAAPSTATAGPGSAPASVGDGQGGTEVERLREALADAAAEMSEREEELAETQQQVQQLQQLLKSQSDALADVQGREEELARERSVLAREAGGGSVATALQALEAQVTRQKATIVSLEEQLEMLADREDELRKCRDVIADMERHKAEVDGLLDEVAEDRQQRDAVIAELKKLRVSVQQKDALIAELNEQIHMPSQQADAAASLFKTQQMQRDIQELRTAVHQRDSLIAELNARMQNEGGGDIATAGILAERERALAAQTEQLQLVSQHQFEMQAQLASVQKALQEQQASLAQQAVDAERQQQHQFLLAAQAQQLAALQMGLNSVGGAPRSGLAPAPGGESPLQALQLDAPEPQVSVGGQGEVEDGRVEESSRGEAGAMMQTLQHPTSQEWSQSMGVQAVEEQVRKARSLARSAAAAAAVARRQQGMSRAIPADVTM